MKGLVLATLLAGSVSIALAQQNPEDHAAHHPAQAAPASKPAPATPSNDTMAAGDVQHKMDQMQALMDRLATTRDPAERDRLLAQHRQAMREQLASMKHMDCRMEMGAAAGEGKSNDPMTSQGMQRKSGSESGAADKSGPGAEMMGPGMMMESAMMKCHELMQARMKLMLGMMDQMIQHDDAQHSAH